MSTEANNTEHIIDIQNLRKSFGDNCVLDGFNMYLNKGENVVIMGKSGSGKSVMIKCLIGLEEPDSGTIKIMGKDISKISTDELNELRTEIGFLFQGSALYDSMSVRENLEFPLRRHTKKFGKIKDTTQLVMEALENVGLAHAIDLMPNELSGGMKRRIALARTLILQPSIILYDEPTTGLDPNQLVEIRNVIKNVGKDKTVFLSTHIMQEVKSLCDRVIIIKNGKLVADDSIEVLQEKLGDRQMVTIEFSTEIPISTIKSLPYVQFVKQSGKHQFTIYSDSAKDLRELLFQTSVSNGWVIYEMNKTKNSIEDVFNVLTKQ